MSDHYHYEYAEARHDHHGEYAYQGHDHDIVYAEKHHRHYSDERTVEELRGQVRELRAIMIEFGLELSEAQGRIHALERQLAARADGDAGEADDVASGGAEYVDEVPSLPRLRPMGVCCTRAVHDDSTGWWCPEHGDQP